MLDSLDDEFPDLIPQKQATSPAQPSPATTARDPVAETHPVLQSQERLNKRIDAAIARNRLRG